MRRSTHLYRACVASTSSRSQRHLERDILSLRVHHTSSLASRLLIHLDIRARSLLCSLSRRWDVEHYRYWQLQFTCVLAFTTLCDLTSVFADLAPVTLDTLSPNALVFADGIPATVDALRSQTLVLTDASTLALHALSSTTMMPADATTSTLDTGRSLTLVFTDTSSTTLDTERLLSLVHTETASAAVDTVRLLTSMLTRHSTLFRARHWERSRMSTRAVRPNS